jgi:ABC-2 type transport system ATP-binding protein
MIVAEGLTKRFDQFLAVDDVSFIVQPGEVMALLGPNGAGKTTTVRMLSSVLVPTAGKATVAGYDVVRQGDQVRAAIGVLTEQHGLYSRMTAVEYLRFFGQLYHMDGKALSERAEALLVSFGLHDELKKRLGEYSKGMRQKLALARALIHDPPVLLLDEPTSAMDPESAHMVRESILSLRSEKRAIVLCTHNLSEAEMLADQIAIIRRGRIILNGRVPELKRSLLGLTEYEIRLASRLNGALPALPGGVVITGRGEDWLRYQVEDPQGANPQIVRRLVEAQMEVVAVQEVPRSLEQVYLRAVSSADGEDSHAD